MEELQNYIDYLTKRCRETRGTGINPNKEQHKNYYKQLGEAQRVKKGMELLKNGILY